MPITDLAESFADLKVRDAIANLLGLDNLWKLIASKLDITTIAAILKMILPPQYDILIDAILALITKARQQDATKAQVEGLIMQMQGEFGAAECCPGCDGECKAIQEFVFTEAA